MIMRVAIGAIVFTLLHLGSFAQIKEVTLENFDDFIWKQPLLIEFYTTSCHVCHRFETTFIKIGAKLSNQGFSSGKVDANANQALTSRFGVRSVPTLFLIRDGTAYKYDGVLTEESVKLFARTDYKNAKSLYWWESPIGPVGRLRGLLVYFGLKIKNLQPVISKSMGVSESIAILFLVFGFSITILVLTILGIYLSVSHIKLD